MKIASPKLNTAHLTENEEALLRCQSALELKDKGDYNGAQEMMRPFWRGLGERPKLKTLHPSVQAEVLLCAGVLTGWIGAKNQETEAQEIAKNLITESINFYESIGDVKKVAAARVEIAYCYWREGAFDEAHVMLEEALQKLTVEGNTRARALLRLAIVDWSACRYKTAFDTLTNNSGLFRKISNASIKGAYHSQVALVLRALSTTNNREEFFRQAISEYKEADIQFKLARNTAFRSDVQNNLGYLLFKIGRTKEAHEYLTQSRRLANIVRDKTRTAQIDETRAQVLIAERKYKEAETVARGAVAVLEKSGQQGLLADALITHGVALSRLKKTDQAQFTFQRAIEISHQVGALNKAGLAALTLVEELNELPAEVAQAAYNRASEWLVNSQSQEILLRLNTAARRVLLNLRGRENEDVKNSLLNKPCDLQAEVLRYEGTLIRQALGKVSGSVTRAAALLGMSYQGLAYIIQSRHKDLLKERSPIRRRSRKD